MRGPIDLFVLLNLLVDPLVGLLALLALLSVRLGGAAAEAAHDRGPGQRVRGLRMPAIPIRGPAHRIDHAHFETAHAPLL